MEFPSQLRLDGRYVRLIPLERSHTEALSRAGSDPSVWAFLRWGNPTTLDGMRVLIDHLLELRDGRNDVPFTVLEASSGTPVGMTRFLDVDRANGTVEVGGTWYTPRLWRTPVNTEAKRLLLGYAFDTEHVRRVQLKTDLRNARSQAAIARLGAVREGVLREHIRLPDGHQRSSVVFSIVASEWPSVRERLDAMLARPWPGSAPAPS